MRLKVSSTARIGVNNAANDYGDYKGSAANHQYVIQNVIDVLKCNKVCSCDSNSWNDSQPAKAEEVAHIHETQSVDSGCCQVETKVALRACRVKTSILKLGSFGIKHHVAKGFILVSKEITDHVVCSLVKITILVHWVSGLFMRVN
jgi:hypothetical protein